jgi:hypothetical protein
MARLSGRVILTSAYFIAELRSTRPNTYFDPPGYIASIDQEHAFCLAAERLIGLEAAPRSTDANASVSCVAVTLPSVDLPTDPVPLGVHQGHGSPRSRLQAR